MQMTFNDCFCMLILCALFVVVDYGVDLGPITSMDILAARAAAIVARGAVGRRRSAVGRAYSSEPTSVPVSAGASPIVGVGADFPRNLSRTKLTPIISEFKTHFYFA